jgi:hypothetical protein
MRISKATKKLKKWKEVLRLQDWEIIIEDIKKPSKKMGDFSLDRDTKSAIVKLDFSNKKENIEKTLIHELLHIKLIDLDEIIEKTLYELFPKGEKEKGYNIIYNEFLKYLETAIEDLAKGFSKLAKIKTSPEEIKSLIERRK